MHRPECVFENSADHTDASLLQMSANPDDLTQQEKAGKTATLKLHVPLCDADSTDSTTASDGVELALLDTFRFGENSRAKGFEHVNDHLPKYSALLDVSVPDSIDLRDKYPKCFPTLSGKAEGTETVRNQGTCGSCWAFAAATTTMTNLCISVNGASDTHNGDNDRMEVSTQKIISCKPKGESTQ